jgi:hypothetical protein
MALVSSRTLRELKLIRLSMRLAWLRDVYTRPHGHVAVLESVELRAIDRFLSAAGNAALSSAISVSPAFG